MNAMILDIKTLSFTSGLTSILMFLTLFLVLKTTKTYKGFSMWTLGYAFIALGMVFLSLRHIAPDFITINIANLCIALFLIFCDRGTSQYCNQKSNNILHIALILFQILSFIYYTQIEPNIPNRILIISFLFVIIPTHIIYTLLRYSKNSLPKQPVLLYTGFGMAIIWFLIRIIFTAYSNPSISDFMRSGNFQAIAIIMVLVIPIINTFGYIITNNQRLESDYNDTIDKLKLSEQKLLSSEKQLLDALQTKSEFLSNMSHEIRTPLNAVTGFSELLEGLVQDVKQRSYLTSIKMAGKTLLRLINDILDLSKIEAGKMKIKSDYFQICTLFNEMNQIFKVKAEEKGLDLVINCGHNTTFILLDEIRIRQILLNLIGNAIKFTDKGSVTVTSTLDKEEQHGTFTITVKDTGIGIAPKDQEKIFEAFQQQEGHDTKRFGGTGLGLSISNRLVKMQGGSINISSNVNEGSTFTITFPNVQWSDSIIKEDISSNSSIADKYLNFKNSEVWIVDDIISNRKLLEEQLEHVNIKFKSFSEAKSLLEALNYNLPKLIITDIRMPEMSGIEMSQRIKEMGNSSIPIIALTASVGENSKEIKSDLFSSSLTKPIEVFVLYEELKKYLPYSNNPPENTPETAEKSIKISPQMKQFIAVNFVPHLEKVEGAFKINETLDLGKKLLEKSIETEDKLAKDLAQQIIDAANTFDVVSIKRIFIQIRNLT